MIQLVLHHARKDLRAGRPWLFVWLALLAFTVAGLVPAVDLAALRGTGGFHPGQYLLSGARRWLGMVRAVEVVHADAPSGTTAFWLTRPLGARAVLSAKLLVLAGLVAVAAAASVAGLLLNSMAASMAPAAFAEIALFEAIPILPLAVVASLTRDTARIAMAGLACLVPFLAARVAVVNVAAYGGRTLGAGVLVLGVVAVACSLWCLGAQYLGRRTRRTLGFAALGAALMAAVGFVAPFAPGPASVNGQWAAGASVTATLRPYVPPRPTGLAPAPTRRLYAYLDLHGLPQGIVVRPRRVNGMVRFQDGKQATFDESLSWGAFTIVG